MRVDSASFRDPGGRVLIQDGRILRVLSERGASCFDATTRSGLFDALQERQWIQPFHEADPLAAHDLPYRPAKILQQRTIPFVSYPYEWSFSLLKEAALRHLDIQLLALEHDIALSDASAFNIQFVGAEPVFIDLCSFRPYSEGEYWLGNQQFLDQFLNPLLLSALLGVSFAPWMRGSIAGIPTIDLQRLLRLRHRLSWRVLVNVELPAYFQRRAHQQQRARQDLKTRSYPRSAYRATLTQLRDLIAGLDLSSKTSVWANYEDHNTYSEAEHRSKQSFVGAFMAKHRPTTVWDLGCNQGEYAELAIRSGAGRVIGFDGDLQVLEKAFRRAKSGSLDFLPLYCDAANPSPDQGWNQCERAGLRARRNADAVLALAFLHHLVIGCTIPLEAAVAWIVDCAPAGVVEFVDKTDPTVTRMLALREDVFPAYTKASFVQILSRRARIVGEAVLESGSRTLFAYQRP